MIVCANLKRLLIIDAYRLPRVLRCLSAIISFLSKPSSLAQAACFSSIATRRICSSLWYVASFLNRTSLCKRLQTTASSASMAFTSRSVKSFFTKFLHSPDTKWRIHKGSRSRGAAPSDLPPHSQASGPPRRWRWCRCSRSPRRFLDQYYLSYWRISWCSLDRAGDVPALW